MSSITIKNLTVDFYSSKTRSTLKETFLSFFRKSDNTLSHTPVLSHINIEMNKGERIALIGKNGMGKSTLLKVIAGVYPPTNGIVNVCGDVTALIELGSGFDESLTGRENIYLILATRGKSTSFIKNAEKAIIDFSELGKHIDLPVKNYSSGMRSRLFFSIAMSTDNEILILDEVFATGDGTFVKKATAKVLQAIDDSHIVLMVSHNLKRLEDICTRGIVIHQSKVVMDGPINSAIEYYKSKILND